MNKEKINKRTRPEWLNELNHHIGTSHYYKHPMGYHYTDGVADMADKYGAFWLIDVIASHAMEHRDHHFLTGLLRLEPGTNKATFELTDGNGSTLAKQKIPFTDFPALKQDLWFSNGVIMLPSEY